MIDTEKLTTGLAGMLGAGIMIKAADMTIDMIGKTTRPKKKKKTKKRKTRK